MIMQDINRIEELLPRYCEGEVSDDERLLVEEWIAQSDDNYRIAKQIYTINLATDTMNVLSKVNTEKALANVFRKMSDRRKTGWFIWLQRIAAILFIPVLIILLVQNFSSKPQLVKKLEVRTNPGMTTRVDLPDGSVVLLNSESSLSYPSSFDGNIRDVYLKGEAFFSVTKDDRKRFVVSTPHETRIEVLGTEFNVEAFEKDSVVSTTLVRGKVRFSYVEEARDKSVTLKAGEKLVYNPKQSKVNLYATTGETETAWKDGKVIFSDTRLPEALHMLSKRYNVEFVIKNDLLKKESFTGSFTHQRLERILEVFKISSNIKWRYLNADNATDEKTRIEIY